MHLRVRGSLIYHRKAFQDPGAEIYSEIRWKLKAGTAQGVGPAQLHTLTALQGCVLL